ncbi:MAG: hypothetical protein OEL19_02930 [Sulfurimonas sp.]|nr:hypothetical protein [Sulfurimonas sp.]
MRDIPFYQMRDKILKIGKEAVKKAQRDSLERGIPNVYSRNGKLYYELTNHNITTETPKEYR